MSLRRHRTLTFKLQEGQTYYNDGSSIFDVYIEGGLEKGWLEEAKRTRDPITVNVDALANR